MGGLPWNIYYRGVLLLDIFCLDTLYNLLQSAHFIKQGLSGQSHCLFVN